MKKTAKKKTPAKKKHSRDEFTPLQQRFVEEMLLDPTDQQAAAIRAGTTPRRAKVTASEWMAMPHIKAKLEAARVARSERVEVTADYVVTNLREIVERCMQRAPVMEKLDGIQVPVMDAAGNHIWEFDSKGALGALGLLGKHLGMFADKVQHSGSVTVNVVYSDE